MYAFVSKNVSYIASISLELSQFCLFELVIIELNKLFLKLLLPYYFGLVAGIFLDFGGVDNPM